MREDRCWERLLLTSASGSTPSPGSLSETGRIFASFLIIGGLGTAIYTFTRLGQVLLEGELLGGLGRRRMRKELSGLKEHYILCGFGRAATPVAEGLAHKNLPFCVV